MVWKWYTANQNLYYRNISKSYFNLFLLPYYYNDFEHIDFKWRILIKSRPPISVNLSVIENAK